MLFSELYVWFLHWSIYLLNYTLDFRQRQLNVMRAFQRI